MEQQIDVPISLKSINLDEEEHHMGPEEIQAFHIATAQDVIAGWEKKKLTTNNWILYCWQGANDKLWEGKLIDQVGILKESLRQYGRKTGGVYVFQWLWG